MKVLVTGGAGYIGSHTVLELFKKFHSVCVLDNFSNSSPESLNRAQKLAGQSCEVINIDIRDTKDLKKVFRDFLPDAVIHFAGLKSVGASVQEPVEYYDCNVNGSISLLKAMDEVNCNNIIFSSSATV